MPDLTDAKLPCEDKASYSTKQEAAAAAIVARHQHGSINLEPYHCPHCELWHLRTYFND